MVLLLQGPYATGSFSLSFTLSTRFGQALLVRLLLTGVFAVLVARALQRPSPALTLGAGACVLGILATWTLTDHSRTGVQTWLGVPAATVHLLAMALWFGGLALLLVCVLGRGHGSLEPVAAALLAARVDLLRRARRDRRLSRVAPDRRLAALPATDFGKLLLIKSGIVLVIVALASASRRAVARMGGDVARRLRRTVLAEVVLGVVVLGVTATLVNAEPARVAYAPPVDVTVAGPEGGRIQLHMEPAKQGENVLDIYLLAKGGGLIIPPEVTARLAPADGEDVGALPIDLAAAEPGHYVAPRMTVPSPAAGRSSSRCARRTSTRTSTSCRCACDEARGAGGRARRCCCPRPRSAHVTVLPESSRPGETTDLTFRVPNERDDAATVQVDVFLPKGVPAKVSSPDGWTQVALGTGEVRWTADEGKAINPGRTRGLQGPARAAAGRAADRVQGAPALRRRAGRALDPGPDRRAAARRRARPRGRQHADRRHRSPTSRRPTR